MQIKCSTDTFFSKMVYVILGSSYHTDVCSIVYCFDKFGFNQLFEAIKTGCAQLLIGSDGCIGESAATTAIYLHRLWLQTTPKLQDGSAHIQDILASLLYSGGWSSIFIYSLWYRAASLAGTLVLFKH